MSTAALIIFFISTSIHLYASYKTDQKLRNKTKPFILLSLIVFYLAAAEPFALIILLALVFSWFGDVLLIPKGVKWFTIGGISFMVSHVLFIFGYAQDIIPDTVSAWVIAGMELVFLAIVTVLFTKLKQHLPKKLFYPMFFYLFINGTMNCFAILRMLSNPCTATALTCIGAVLFFISDSTLFFVRFNKNSRIKTHFLVMLTYSIGELLIVLGLI